MTSAARTVRSTASNCRDAADIPFWRENVAGIPVPEGVIYIPSRGVIYIPRRPSAAATFVCWMEVVHHSRKERNLVDPFTILSLINIGTSIAANVVALANNAIALIAPLLPPL